MNKVTLLFTWLVTGCSTTLEVVSESLASPARDGKHLA